MCFRDYHTHSSVMFDEDDIFDGYAGFSTLSHNQSFFAARALSIEHTSFSLPLLFIPYPSFFIVFYFPI